MSYLIFDTETSGIPRKDLPPFHPDQARIMQLAFLLLDEEFKERASFCSLLSHDTDYNVHPKAFEAHGISKEDCQKYGITADSAINELLDQYQHGRMCIGHNIPFDRSCVALVQNDVAQFDPNNLLNREVCTMRLLTPICKLPHKNSYSQRFSPYKWPTLQEAHTHIFGHGFEKAHDALADVRATSRLFEWLFKRGYVSKPLGEQPRDSEGLAASRDIPQPASSPSQVAPTLPSTIGQEVVTSNSPS